MLEMLTRRWVEGGAKMGHQELLQFRSYSLPKKRGRTGHFKNDGLRLISLGCKQKQKTQTMCKKPTLFWSQSVTPLRPPTASQWAAVRITTEACCRCNPHGVIPEVTFLKVETQTFGAKYKNCSEGEECKKRRGSISSIVLFSRTNTNAWFAFYYYDITVLS